MLKSLFSTKASSVLWTTWVTSRRLCKLLVSHMGKGLRLGPKTLRSSGNEHTTPFEMCEIKFHVKLPIFVARQWVRHRTANINEHSARYSILKNEFYLPNRKHLAEQNSQNRQGRGSIPLDRRQADAILKHFVDDAQRAFSSYHW